MKRQFTLTVTFALAAICLVSGVSGTEAAPTLEPVVARPFRDNGVLQQEIHLPVWGQSLPGAKVTVGFDGKSATATADAEGRWRVMLAPLTAVPLKSVNHSPDGQTMTVVCMKDGEQATAT